MNFTKRVLIPIGSYDLPTCAIKEQGRHPNPLPFDLNIAPLEGVVAIFKLLLTDKLNPRELVDAIFEEPEQKFFAGHSRNTIVSSRFKIWFAHDDTSTELNLESVKADYTERFNRLLQLLLGQEKLAFIHVSRGERGQEGLLFELMELILEVNPDSLFLTVNTVDPGTVPAKWEANIKALTVYHPDEKENYHWGGFRAAVTALIGKFVTLPKKHLEILAIPVGMFAVFYALIGGLHFYEENAYTGVRINQKEVGLYYSPARGPDWFSYYFEPVEVGSFDSPPVQGLDESFVRIAYHADLNLSRKEVFTLIQKYIKVKPDVIKVVDDFCASFFKESYIIGVHYRGCDKKCEAPILSYAHYIDVIKAHVDSLGADKEFKIFVATDEDGFLKSVQAHFSEKVISYETKRSTDGSPVHVNSGDPYQTGLASVVDCLLLSRCSFLIRSSSNLSAISACFSPDMPVQEVTQRYR